jgi:hypothetical protein
MPQSFMGGRVPSMSHVGGSNINSFWNSYGSGVAEMVGLLKTNLYQLGKHGWSMSIHLIV